MEVAAQQGRRQTLALERLMDAARENIRETYSAGRASLKIQMRRTGNGTYKRYIIWNEHEN